jgi:hypothetical protein
MNRKLVACTLLVALGMPPAIARAGEINVAWDTCYYDGGVMVKAFACNTNADTPRDVLVLSFVPDHDIPTFNGADAHLNFCFYPNTVPAWWGTSCSGRTVFSAVADPLGPCSADAWGGAGANSAPTYAVGMQWNGGLQSNPFMATLDVTGALTTGQEQFLTGGSEYFLFALSLSHAGTTGAGSCPGCTSPVAICFTQLDVTDAGGGPAITLGPPGSSSPNAFWQASNFYTCCGTVPTRKPTWGAVKSLYR